tara:strand:- start:1011 stop:1544 length:534 start_codon:yes stop_codon:yes gene_type:complete
MLGLGNNIIKGGGAIEELILTYTSDFTSGVDGWEKYSVDQGDLALAANQTIDSSGGWLKCTYDATQTSLSGIQRQIGVPVLAGDRFVEQFTIYIVDDSGKWDPEGDSDAVSVKHTITNNNLIFGANLDESVTRSGATSNNGLGAADPYIILQFATADDFPQAGAVFFIKDYTLSIFR